MELVEVEMVRLAEPFELPLLQCRDNRSRAATKAAIVDPGNTRIMVREFRLDFGVGNKRREFLLDGEIGLGVVSSIKVVVKVVRGCSNLKQKLNWAFKIWIF